MAVATPTLSFYNEPSGMFSQASSLSANPSLMMSDYGALTLGSTLTMGGQSLFNYGDSSNFGSPWDLYTAYAPTNLFCMPCNASLQSEPLGYPSEEVPDLLLMGADCEFLQQISGSTPVMHPNLVSTLKNMVAPGPAPAAPYSDAHSLFGQQLQQHHSADHGLGSAFFAHCSLPLEDQAQTGHCKDGAAGRPATGSPAAAEAQAVPQPFAEPLQAVEKSETEDSIEAAVVSVDLIQNRRPFRCHHEGCNKTFKNPQTMKMHHKTHYTDGSAASRAGLMTLPTLTSSLKAGHNKKIPSRCPKCKKTFVGLYELRRHYGRKHSEGEKPYGCRKCGKKFYIEVDVRDHEKLCGEPIECKCGLKFAFKCNLVAHKKAHPACQDHASNNNNSSANSASSSSSDDSVQSRGSSPAAAGRGTRRQREETLSTIQSALYTPVPDFQGVPEAPEFKMARHEYSGAPFPTHGNAILWASADNVQYPFAGFPMASLYPSSLNGGDQLGAQHYATMSKMQQGPFYDAFNGEMGITYNPSSLHGTVRLN